jgi:hypothetical protein
MLLYITFTVTLFITVFLAAFLGHLASMSYIYHRAKRSKPVISHSNYSGKRRKADIPRSPIDTETFTKLADNKING